MRPSSAREINAALIGLPLCDRINALVCSCVANSETTYDTVAGLFTLLRNVAQHLGDDDQKLATSEALLGLSDEPLARIGGCHAADSRRLN